MNTQPEALRLADWLDLGNDPYDKAAAAELRRLHEVNQELVKALKEVRDGWDCDEDSHRYGTRCRRCVARDTLAKTRGTE